jgi:tRNA nucleotidyltransferase (CCA-adding enzyme)
VREARRAGSSVWLVGGPVRDLLLRRPVLDVDLLVSRRLTEIARALAPQLGGSARLRPRFLTATVEAEGWRIDLAQARRERYPRPGALPIVEPAPVLEDLARRDFSINAMALRIDATPELLDPFDGRRDLARRQLRSLHAASFLDDPTRLLRASRYAARLNFAIERTTRRRLREALAAGALDAVSGERIGHELDRLIQERDPAAAARHASRCDLLAAIAPGWRLSARGARGLVRLAAARETPPWPGASAPELVRACGLPLLLLGAPPRVRERAVDRLGLRGRRASRIGADLAAVSRLERALARPLSDGRLDAQLGGADPTVLLLLYCAASAAVVRRAQRYVVELRGRPSPLDGRRAERLGFRGPAIGAAIRAARHRALDGEPVDDVWLRRRLARTERIQ